jgi:hypothetical protein
MPEPPLNGPGVVALVGEGLATFRRKIDVFGRTVNGFGRAKTAGLPAVFFEGLW